MAVYSRKSPNREPFGPTSSSNQGNPCACAERNTEQELSPSIISGYVKRQFRKTFQSTTELQNEVERAVQPLPTLVVHLLEKEPHRGTDLQQTAPFAGDNARSPPSLPGKLARRSSAATT